MEELNFLNRRQFIRLTGLAGVALAMGRTPLQALVPAPVKKITILHTNDVHSRIEPFPYDGSRNQGTGGAAARSNLIGKIRQEEKNVLLFDAGDAFQGTPYFNFFHGELEYKLMSQMKYNAGTIGNHEFDAGTEGIAKAMQFASFPLINSNYDFSGSALEGLIPKNKIIECGGIKVGIYALGIELQGLVPEKQYGEIKYGDPLKAMKEQEEYLKNTKKCDLLICLSHLGYEYQSDKISDVAIAKQTSYTNLIVGGHTHTFMKEPLKVKNLLNNDCHIFQVGWGGINLGRVDFIFGKNNQAEVSHIESIKIFEKNI